MDFNSSTTLLGTIKINMILFFVNYRPYDTCFIFDNLIGIF